ncbi:MAG: hypothetical protein EU530_01010 [Promethearchaeota archaeon]|nr:MAG: hypothetical protein EU530_01010 [Candidatus Lokiarchaeota archaeon]
MKIKIHRSLIVIGLCILLTYNIVQSSSTPNNYSNLSENSHTPTSATSLGMEPNPFFDHYEEDVELYLQLNNTVDTYDADYFYHSFTNNPEFTITDANYFATDLIYFLMGFGNTLTDIDLVDYSGTPLWDSTNGGFYTKTLDSFTQVSTEKKVFDNLLYILALLEGAESASQTSGLANKITAQWYDVVDIFWDNTNNAFNHSNANLDERYSADNFLGAIVAFSIAKSPLFTQTVRDSAANFGEEIMTTFNSEMYDAISGQEGFYNTSDIANNKIGSNNKNLLTNALGILALLEWNIQNGYAVDSAEVLQAERIWRFLNTKLFDGVDQLYITETNFNGNIVITSDMYLLQNAWMLKASLELFKHSGNTTYYISALDNFNGIETNLYDQSNSGYYSLAGSSEKKLDGYGMLINSLTDFYEIYIESEIITEFNQSEYIHSLDPNMNLSLSFDITMDFSYSVLGESWSISASIYGASINYILRYAENTTIISSESRVTDASGNNTYLYDLSTLTSYYEYELYIQCNRTGFLIGAEKVTIPLISGIEIISFELVEGSNHYNEPLRQGNSVEYNITYTSSRTDNINATTITAGDNFSEEISAHYIILREDEIDGKKESSVIARVNAKDSAELGNQILEISVLNNNSKPIFYEEFELEIQSVVEIESLWLNEYLLDFNPEDLMLTFYNHHEINNQTITVEINGTEFTYSNTLVEDLLPQSRREILIPLIPNDLAKMGSLNFILTIRRGDVIIFTQNLSIQAVPEIEILSITTQTLSLLQGQAPTVTIRLFNYNSTYKQIFVKSNGVQVLDKTVIFGETRFVVELDKNIRNPYNVGKEVYEIEIVDNLGKILATKVITVNIKPSTLNIFLFYVVPILIPVGIIVYFKYKELEQLKRTK